MNFDFNSLYIVVEKYLNDFYVIDFSLGYFFLFLITVSNIIIMFKR